MATVTRQVEAFVDDLSNWYVRRSRAALLEERADSDKRAAYSTLYEVLITLTKLIAPIMPFLAEEMYQNLVRQAVGSRRSPRACTTAPTRRPTRR